MKKEVTITFRVETALRDSFFAAVENEYRPGAQVLRELMRSYVSKKQHPSNSDERHREVAERYSANKKDGFRSNETTKRRSSSRHTARGK